MSSLWPAGGGGGDRRGEELWREGGRHSDAYLRSGERHHITRRRCKTRDVYRGDMFQTCSKAIKIKATVKAENTRMKAA